MATIVERTESQLELQVLRTIEELEAFGPEWDAFFEAIPSASPYLCHDWMVTSAIHQGYRNLRVCIARDAEGMLAIVPLFYRRVRGRPFATLRMAGGGWEPRQTGIFAERAAGRGLFEEILRELHRQDRSVVDCFISRVPAGSPLLEPPVPGRGARLVQNRIGGTIVIELPATWEEYRQTLSPAHRKTISRRINALDRLDPKLVRVGLDGAGAGEDIAKLAADALEVSARSWQGSATVGRAISDPPAVEFFRESCRRMAARGMLDLSVLYVGERPISFIWGTARAPITNISKLGFDRDFAEWSPGLVHLAKLIQDSIERGLRAIDFGHEFAEYKSRWSKRADDLYEVWWYPSGLPTLVYWGRKGFRATRSLVRRVRPQRPAAVAAADLSV